MDFLRKRIIHKSFGTGEICEYHHPYFKADFHGMIKAFSFPQSFQGFIQFEDPEVQDALYEMLKEWTAFAGFVLKGDSKRTPMKLSHVEPNSLAILTTRDPYESEADRFVFGVFLVDDAYSGDNQDEGYVTTNSKYKIELTPSEARKIKFWNYYFNENSPQKCAWGQGLHRYMNDIQAAQLLRDIAAVKAQNNHGALAAELFRYFCQIKHLQENRIPSPSGALLR